MTIPIPSDMTLFPVTWRLGRSPSGAVMSGARGYVEFEATAVAVAYSSATWLPTPVRATVTAGVMETVSLPGNDPEVWNWKVTPHVGVRWPAFHVDVEGALDLSHAVVVPGVGPVRAVKGERGDTPTWADLVGKPTSFPSTVSDVEGLAARLAALEYRSGPRRLTTLSNGWTGDVRIARVGPWVQLILNGVSGTAASSEILFALPYGFRPATTSGTMRLLLHVANGSGATTLYRGYVAGTDVRITGGQGLTSALYSDPITFLTDDPIPSTPPWSAA